METKDIEKILEKKYFSDKELEELLLWAQKEQIEWSQFIEYIKILKNNKKKYEEHK